ncbi:hypothetical protein QUF76_17850 [Desulfobacterales bacterium HSG16]|nr:hypothetical protein [Desulfobacterales bacterium HSG16]
MKKKKKITPKPENTETSNSADNPDKIVSEAESSIPKPESEIAGQDVEPSENYDIVVRKTHCKPTPDIIDAVHDGQLLLAYVAHEALIDIDDETLETFVRSKYLIESDQWSPEAEIKFYKKYDRMAKNIQPVTIDSLRATMPLSIYAGPSMLKGKKSKAEKAVYAYSLFALLALMLLLFVQIYSFIGFQSLSRLNQTYEKRSEVRTKIKQEEGKKIDEIDNAVLDKLKRGEHYLGQQLDSDYEILRGWNRVWQVCMFMSQFEAKVTYYINLTHEDKIKRLKTEFQDLKNTFENESLTPEQLKKVRTQEKLISEALLDRELDKARNRLLLTMNSSDYVLKALQSYFLPLLYGLLGAATYVLRRLTIDVRNLTYVDETDIRYRLRLPLGALGGMAVGWFLPPENMSAIKISQVGLAFLIGYNVEVFFAIMDKIISAVKKMVTGEEKKPESRVRISET